MMDANTKIDLKGDISEFFHEALEHAARRVGYVPDEASSRYVSGLLVDFARPDELAREVLDRPLTLTLQEAMELTGHERFERLRTLGDSVLYISGFFSENLERRGVELSYVSALGARAYDNAGAMLRLGASESTALDVFATLSRDFAKFTELLRGVSETVLVSSACSNRSLVDMYERWLETGSRALAEALTSRGLVPVRGRGGAAN